MSRTSDRDLTVSERRTLDAVIDALLPPDGTFPVPSSTDMINDFILKHISVSGTPIEYPGMSLDDLRSMLIELGAEPDITVALGRVETSMPEQFQALWALAVFGYYSRPEVTAAIQHDLAPGYRGAPLPHGYADIISPWDASDPLQHPVNPPGGYIATGDVQPVDLSELKSGAK